MTESERDEARRVIANVVNGRASSVSATTLHTLLAHEPRLASLLRPADRPDGWWIDAPTGAVGGIAFSGTVHADVVRALPDLRSVIARHDPALGRRSSMARLLRRADLRADLDSSDAQMRADRLDHLVDFWLRQRLWSLNLAPELVAHDERHVAAVEDLLTGLVEPFLVKRENLRLSPLEAEWLAVAAWLHDWGHVGGPVTPFRHGGSYPVVSGSREVRLLHGLISQRLMGEHWRGIHGLPSDIAGPAAVLCGHHQSWTSFGEEIPQDAGDPSGDVAGPVRLMADLDVRPLSLMEDVAACRDRVPDYAGLRRFKLLVGLLRVADGADVGRHRVADVGPGRHGFLARCLHWEALRTASALATRPQGSTPDRVGVEIAMGVAIEALQAASAEDFAHRIGDIVDHGIDEIAGLSRYARFVQAQEAHFRKHQLVEATRFERVGGYFDVVVVPALTPDGETRPERAVDAVANDVRRELEKADVGKVLDEFGVRFRRARTADTYDGGSYTADL